MSSLEQESRPATSVPGQPKNMMRDRIQALRHDSSSGSSILSASPTPPLPALAGEYEWSDSGRSAFSPSSVSSCSDPIQDLDATLPLPPLDPLERFTNEGLGLKASSPHHVNGHSHEDYDEEIPTTRDLLSSAPTRTRSAYQDLSLIAPPLHGSPIDFGSPPFMEFSEKPSRRALMGHFCNVLSQLMVFKEDAGNPFRQYLVPMAARSAPILNALLAISSAHLEHRGFQTEERALDLHSASLQGLARIISQNDKSNRDEVLGVIMLLVYYEVIQSGSSIVLDSHLRGALSIMRGQRSKHGPTSAFLEKVYGKSASYSWDVVLTYHSRFAILTSSVLFHSGPLRFQVALLLLQAMSRSLPTNHPPCLLSILCLGSLEISGQSSIVSPISTA